jgi:hypothetical protein
VRHDAADRSTKPWVTTYFTCSPSLHILLCVLSEAILPPAAHDHLCTSLLHKGILIVHRCVAGWISISMTASSTVLIVMALFQESEVEHDHHDYACTRCGLTVSQRKAIRCLDFRFKCHNRCLEEWKGLKDVGQSECFVQVCRTLESSSSRLAAVSSPFAH